MKIFNTNFKCKKSKYVKYPLTDLLILHNVITQTRFNINKPTFPLFSYNPQDNGHVQSKCGCLQSTFLCVICKSDLLFSLVTMDTAQICFVTILLNIVGC